MKNGVIQHSMFVQSHINYERMYQGKATMFMFYASFSYGHEW